jgi:hypothetical protein
MLICRSTTYTDIKVKKRDPDRVPLFYLSKIIHLTKNQLAKNRISFFSENPVRVG